MISGMSQTQIGEATSSSISSSAEFIMGKQDLGCGSDSLVMDVDAFTPHQSLVGVETQPITRTLIDGRALSQSEIRVLWKSTNDKVLKLQDTLMVMVAKLDATVEGIAEERKHFIEEREFLMEERRFFKEQVRDMQLMFLRANLSAEGRDNGLSVKPQHHNTPQKVWDSTRLESTPNARELKNKDERPLVRRSLDYQKPQNMLERVEDSPIARHNVPHLDSHVLQAPVPVPKLSLVHVKTEEVDSKSPLCDGLLVLANAALNYAPASKHLDTPSSDSTTSTDYDSGRSSEDSSCRSSPTLSQTGMMKSEKFVRYEVLNSSYPHQSMRNAKPAFVTASQSAEIKARKRRKNKQPLPCNYCGKCFNNQSSLRQHESFHRPVRPFKCDNDNCDKAYKTRSELNRHKIVHEGEKRHECKLCGKRFLRKQYLKTHLLRHHETGLALLMPSAMDNFKDDATGSIPSIVVSSSFVSKAEPLTWRCQMCFKIFVNEEDLSRHVRSYHEKKKSSESRYEISTHHERTETVEST